MADPLRVMLEIRPKGKRVVAVAPDWPGLERRAKTAEAPVLDPAYRVSQSRPYLGDGRQRPDGQMNERQYCVYILTNVHNSVLYTGVTNNLQRRVLQHRSGMGSVFTKKYNVHKLVYFECGDDVNAALAREKQIKAGSRKKKIELINSFNPEWKDLYEEYFG